MRTLNVTREFAERARELADKAQVPEMKVRLRLLADRYQRQLDELEQIESDSIAPG